jgi:hypothetical protein
MSLTPQDLQAIEGLLDKKLGSLEARMDQKLDLLEARIDKKLGSLEARIDQKLDQQTKDIAHVINTVMSSADSTFATKLQVAELEQKVGKIQRHLALDI